MCVCMCVFECSRTLSAHTFVVRHALTRAPEVTSKACICPIGYVNSLLSGGWIGSGSQDNPSA